MAAESFDIDLTLNGTPRRVKVRSDQRLLDLLREDLRLTGAKEGCGKGECGACTVIVDGQAVDACLMLAYQADGARVQTIEGLANGAHLHPLQTAFIEHGGVQCGICIPGMILAAEAARQEGGAATPEAIRQGLAGNLCRCTGYAKIFAAVADATAKLKPPTSADEDAPFVTPAVVETQHGKKTRGDSAPHSLRPRSLEDALEVLAQRAGEIRPLAGGTDVLVVAKDGKVNAGALFDLGAIEELRGIEEKDGHLWIGAATTHTEMLRSPLVARWAPALPAACAVIGGPQIRNRGTLGGNLANASPAADTVPALYVADAVVELVSISARREVPVDRFFTGPRKSVLEPDELIVAVRIPKRAGARGTFLRLGQREAQAISKVSVAVAATFADGRPDWVRVALGSVAPTVIRARETEKALLERGLDGIAAARGAVRDEVRPIDDIRSTREYRREMSAVLLERAARAVFDGAL